MFKKSILVVLFTLFTQCLVSHGALASSPYLLVCGNSDFISKARQTRLFKSYQEFKTDLVEPLHLDAYSLWVSEGGFPASSFDRNLDGDSAVSAIFSLKSGPESSIETFETAARGKSVLVTYAFLPKATLPFEPIGAQCVAFVTGDAADQTVAKLADKLKSVKPSIVQAIRPGWTIDLADESSSQFLTQLKK